MQCCNISTTALSFFNKLFCLPDAGFTLPLWCLGHCHQFCLRRIQVVEMVCAGFWFPDVCSLNTKAGATQSFSLTVHILSVCASCIHGVFCTMHMHKCVFFICIYGTEI